MSEQKLIIRALDVLATVDPVSGEVMQGLLEENELARIELEQARQRIEQLQTDLARRDKEYQQLQAWHKTAWQRGHQIGMAQNESVAREAARALAAERQAHADTNACLTDALMQAEAETERLRSELAACRRDAKSQ